MMDEVDTLGFIAMSVLAALSLTELVSIELFLGLFVLLGLTTAFVRYRRGKKWLAFGWVLFSLSVSSLPFVTGPVVLAIFFGGVVVSMIILLFGQLGLIERLSLPPLRSRSR